VHGVSCVHATKGSILWLEVSVKDERPRLLQWSGVPPTELLQFPFISLGDGRDKL